MGSRHNFCDVCSLQNDSIQAHNLHEVSLVHHIQLEKMVVKDKQLEHSCRLCLFTCNNLADYSKHVNAESHIQRATFTQQLIARKKESRSRTWDSAPRQPLLGRSPPRGPPPQHWAHMPPPPMEFMKHFPPPPMAFRNPSFTSPSDAPDSMSSQEKLKNKNKSVEHWKKTREAKRIKKQNGLPKKERNQKQQKQQNIKKQKQKQQTPKKQKSNKHNRFHNGAEDPQSGATPPTKKVSPPQVQEADSTTNHTVSNPTVSMPSSVSKPPMEMCSTQQKWNKLLRKGMPSATHRTNSVADSTNRSILDGTKSPVVICLDSPELVMNSAELNKEPLLHADIRKSPEKTSETSLNSNKVVDRPVETRSDISIVSAESTVELRPQRNFKTAGKAKVVESEVQPSCSNVGTKDNIDCCGNVDQVLALIDEAATSQQNDSTTAPSIGRNRLESFSELQLANHRRRKASSQELPSPEKSAKTIESNWNKLIDLFDVEEDTVIELEKQELEVLKAEEAMTRSIRKRLELQGILRRTKMEKSQMIVSNGWTPKEVAIKVYHSKALRPYPREESQAAICVESEPSSNVTLTYLGKLPSSAPHVSEISQRIQELLNNQKESNVSNSIAIEDVINVARVKSESE